MHVRRFEKTFGDDLRKTHSSMYTEFDGGVPNDNNNNDPDFHRYYRYILLFYAHRPMGARNFHRRTKCAATSAVELRRPLVASTQFYVIAPLGQFKLAIILSAAVRLNFSFARHQIFRSTFREELRN